MTLGNRCKVPTSAANPTSTSYADQGCVWVWAREMTGGLTYLHTKECILGAIAHITCRHHIHTSTDTSIVDSSNYRLFAFFNGGKGGLEFLSAVNVSTQSTMLRREREKDDLPWYGHVCRKQDEPGLLRFLHLQRYRSLEGNGEHWGLVMEEALTVQTSSKHATWSRDNNGTNIFILA
jgi:hypothetical protein